ncbi:hypothetical protein FAI41_04295 [Acetobacteraceae bacterium]|nr:hypothetical protein FAI41_04295 [Acetobacteraceae bacterium]
MTKRPTNWNKQIKEILEKFSDIHWQKNAFLMKAGLASSPDEMCCWPEDFLMEEWVRENLTLFPKKLQENFKKFFCQIEVIPEDTSYKSPDAALLADEWIEMRRLTTEILQQLEDIPLFQT